MLRGDGRIGPALVLTAIVGAQAATLVALGNPGNMGICGACFLRDTAGALGMFSGPGPKVFRPELAGLVLGALAFRFGSRRFEARSGSYAATRFLFGALMAIGALVFLGCPFRMLQRLGGGDLNAWIGLPGFVAGVGLGLWFENRSYRVGRTQAVPAPVGLLGPFTMVVLLVLFLTTDVLGGPAPGAAGPPAHAHWIWALLIAGVAGAIMSATGFCAISAARQVFQKKKRMLLAAGVFVATYAIVSVATGKFSPGIDGQPAAHDDALWSILALAMVGLCGCLVGGCPVRQLIMTGEGNGDAFVTVAGMLVGGALAHDLGLASSGAGTTSAGRTIVIAGLVVAVAYAAAVSRVHRAQD